MEKILIYGMGYEAQKLIKNMANSSLWQIVAVTDSTTHTRGGVFETAGISLPMIVAEDIDKTACDYIVIASTKFEGEIRQRLESMFPEYDNIYSIGEFYYKIFLKENEGRLRDNVLYNYIMCRENIAINKWFHFYRIYERYFSKFRGTDVVFLEIGVDKGGSLQMWSEYFGEKATVIGVDIDEKCKVYEQGNAKVEIGSQEAPEFWEYIKKKYPRIDILLDDGGHTMNQQIVTFECMFPFISDGGIYMCEDTHTSYMEGFGAGYGGKNFIDYSKKFIDDLHAYFATSFQANYNTEAMHSVHYYDSIVVVEKELASDFPIILTRDGEIMTADLSLYKLPENPRKHWKSK